MDALFGEAWRLYHEASDLAYVVNPSIPILFFGDSERYAQSALKVITVGLNPSRAEFPADDPFTRFRRAQHVYPKILGDHGYADYLGALNEYFRRNPYRQWFNSFEPILNGMDSSYYDGHPNAALHTDLCSPLATDPTWSGLSDISGKRAMEHGGRELWLRLVRHLAPDVILISVARHHVQTLDQQHLPLRQAWQSIYVVTSGRTRPYHVEARELEISDGKSTLLVFGQASQTPFGKVGNTDKQEIGRRIMEKVHAR